jgi:RimJ/RimL family protein N-acetyltransferase
MDGLGIPTLETERLWLRSFRKSDIDDYAALKADPEVARYLGGGGAWDRGRSWRHLAFLLGHWQLGGSGMWAVEQKETGAFLGMIGFADPEGWPGFELAWTLVRRWWGYGYATEGARSALAYAFTALNKGRVISLIHPENLASIRVAERLGESLQGRTDMMGNERLVFGIDREGYAAQVASELIVLKEPVGCSRLKPRRRSPPGERSGRGLSPARRAKPAGEQEPGRSPGGLPLYSRHGPERRHLPPSTPSRLSDLPGPKVPGPGPWQSHHAGGGKKLRPRPLDRRHARRSAG